MYIEQSKKLIIARKGNISQKCQVHTYSKCYFVSKDAKVRLLHWIPDAKQNMPLMWGRLKNTYTHVDCLFKQKYLN